MTTNQISEMVVRDGWKAFVLEPDFGFQPKKINQMVLFNRLKRLHLRFPNEPLKGACRKDSVELLLTSTVARHLGLFQQQRQINGQLRTTIWKLNQIETPRLKLNEPSAGP